MSWKRKIARFPKIVKGDIFSCRKFASVTVHSTSLTFVSEALRTCFFYSASKLQSTTCSTAQIDQMFPFDSSCPNEDTIHTHLYTCLQGSYSAFSLITHDTWTKQATTTIPSQNNDSPNYHPSTSEPTNSNQVVVMIQVPEKKEEPSKPI